MASRYVNSGDITDEDDPLVEMVRDDELVNVEMGPVPLAPGPGSAPRSQPLCTQARLFYGLWAAVTVVLFFVVIVLASRHRSGSDQVAQPCLTPSCVALSARVYGDMNMSAGACTDFYQYSCGGWVAANIIPDDAGRIGTFDALEESNSEFLRQFLQSNGNRPSTMKAITYYNACMNTTLLDSTAVDVYQARIGAPLAAALSTSLALALAQTHRVGVNALFALAVTPDDMNVSAYIVSFNQGGLAMPRDYYINRTYTADTTLAAYLKYATSALSLLGYSPANASATAWAALLFEQQLANVSLPADYFSDPLQMYHKTPLAQVLQSYPNIPLEAYLAALFAPVGSPAIDQVLVYAPGFLAGLNTLLGMTNKSTIEAYLTVRSILTYAASMTSDFVSIYTQFHSVLTGTPELPPRWDRCVGSADGALGMMLGREYVEAKFTPTAKQEASEMIENIRSAFESSLSSLPWMDAATAALAVEKAQAVTAKIGYPEWIMDDAQLLDYYSNFTVTTNYLTNMINLHEWSVASNLASLGSPVDRAEWDMTPQEVNAYYNPAFNEIVFPAGILQPPFFSVNQLRSINYGGMGAVIGHELTHGFDNSGREYDKNGNLIQWWSNASIAAFDRQVKCLINQYSEYAMDIDGETVHVDGTLTQGENIADNGGLKAAYRAYTTWVAAHGTEAALPGLDLSQDEIFFASFAQVWCTIERPKEALIGLRSDPHSPPEFRVRGAVSNSQQFASAFSCPASSPMVSPAPCVVW